MTKETTKLIIEWFAHIEQMARDRKTQTGAVMDKQHCLDEIAVLASECKQFVEEFQHEQEPINEEELDKIALEYAINNYSYDIGINISKQSFKAGYCKAMER